MADNSSKTEPLRVLSWDIEASNLSADFGIVLCVGFKTVGHGKPKVLNILDYQDASGDLIKAEKRLLKDVSAVLLDSDVWLTHYGAGYDVPFINSRLLYHGLPPVPPNHPHIDTWKVSRYNLKLRNNRLATIQQHLKLAEAKNAIKPEQWLRALGGHRPSMDYIVEHCRLDVLVLEDAYLKLRPLITNHPFHRADAPACPVCGGDSLQRRGHQLTAGGRRYQRYQCSSCGAWLDERKLPRAKKAKGSR